MMQGKNNALNFLKFVFSLAIVAFHSEFLVTNLSDRLLPGGYISVEFFFLVSGGLMLRSAQKTELDPKRSIGRETFRFIKHKIAGLMPNLLVAWVFAFAVSQLLTDSIKDVLKNLAFSIWEIMMITESGVSGTISNSVTWYISAMLLCMLVIYPLLLRYKENMLYIGAPIIVFVIMGHLYSAYGNLAHPREIVFGLFYKGIVKAFAELLLGCICFEAAKAIRNVHFTNLGKGLLTALEWGNYAAVFFVAKFFHREPSQNDFLMLLFLCVGVTITFSQASFDGNIFHAGGVYAFLAKCGFSLYLSHIFWSKFYAAVLPDTWSYYQKTALYLLSAVLTSVAVTILSDAIRKLYAANKEKISEWVLQK